MRQDGIQKNGSRLDIIAFDRIRMEIRAMEQSDGLLVRYNRT